MRFHYYIAPFFCSFPLYTPGSLVLLTSVLCDPVLLCPRLIIACMRYVNVYNDSIFRCNGSLIKSFRSAKYASAMNKNGSEIARNIARRLTSITEKAELRSFKARLEGPKVEVLLSNVSINVGGGGGGGGKEGGDISNHPSPHPAE